MNKTIQHHSVTQEILELFISKGQQSYGERINQREHALQAAMLAEEHGCSPSLVAACLLHDIGHLYYAEFLSEQEIDQQHEHLGADWLKQHFPVNVSEPVRLHVVAKRYLCAVENTYWNTLSAASKHSLELQGGLMNETEVAAFEENPWHEDAVLLRRYDDTAKVQGLETPDVQHYGILLDQLLQEAKR